LTALLPSSLFFVSKVALCHREFLMKRSLLIAMTLLLAVSVESQACIFGHGGKAARRRGGCGGGAAAMSSCDSCGVSTTQQEFSAPQQQTMTTLVPQAVPSSSAEVNALRAQVKQLESQIQQLQQVKNQEQPPKPSLPTPRRETSGQLELSPNPARVAGLKDVPSTTTVSVDLYSIRGE
jgi:hypothetical protein